MKQLRNLFVLATLLGLLSLGLPGCGLVSDSCDDVVCAPCMLFTDDVLVRFDLDSLRGGFRKSELQAAYAVRYATPGFATPLDTIRQQKSQNGFSFLTQISLQRVYYSAPSLQGKPTPTTPFMTYNYRFVLPALGKTYDISELDVKQTQETGGCCSCPFNVRRRFVLNGQPVIADGDTRESMLRR